MKLFLLSHQREMFKASNTGQLVQNALADQCSTLIWQRKQPNEDLLQCIKDEKIALLYPANENEEINSSEAFDHFIIIDSTWQQARKILNQSPYLQTLPKVMLKTTAPSQYSLRRNQQENGLCTAETAIALCKEKSFPSLAVQLQESFDQLNYPQRQ